MSYMTKIHPDFRLNSDFFTQESLLQYAAEIKHHADLHLQLLGDFLESWFSNADFIEMTTSGTTGVPKIIKLQKEAMINSALATGIHFEVLEKTIALHCLPIQYIAGKMMMVRALVLGWSIDYVKPSSAPMVGIDKRYNFGAMVPLQIENSINEIDQFDKIIIGGAKLNNALRSKLMHSSCLLFETYGMTETITHIAAKKIDEETFSALKEVIFEVDDRGCLVVFAPRVHPEKLITNDSVELIDGKHFVWNGRVDNVVNSGGVKLFPEKIEEKLSNFIQDNFFVNGVADAHLGSKLVLFIEGSQNDKIDFDRAFKSLSRFEVPKKIIYIDAFLYTETGKLKRAQTVKSQDLTF